MAEVTVKAKTVSELRTLVSAIERAEPDWEVWAEIPFMPESAASFKTQDCNPYEGHIFFANGQECSEFIANYLDTIYGLYVGVYDDFGVHAATAMIAYKMACLKESNNA